MMGRFLKSRWFLRSIAVALIATALVLPLLGNVGRVSAATPGSNTFPTTGPDALYQINESGWSGPSQTSDTVNGWGDDQWQITLSSARSVSIQVADCCIVGDNYEVYVDSQLIGTTPQEPLYGSTPSQGTFTVTLTAGSHLITIRDPGGVFYYQQGDTFMIPAGYNVTISTSGFTDCPTAGSLGITLPTVQVQGATRLKPWGLTYGSLPLTWTPESSPAASAVCTLDSNKGDLPVYLALFGGSNHQIATSSATATLDFMGAGFDSTTIPTCDWTSSGAHNGCFLNTPGQQPAVIEWSTSGFVETVNGINVHCSPCDSGPLTFYVDAASLPGGGFDIPMILQQVENYIHITLITHLPSIDTIALLQEPPNDVLVSDSSGNLTGRLPKGQIVMNIPGSVYIPATTTSGAAVVIVNQPPASYSAEVLGSSGASYTLVMSNADFSSSGLSPTITEVDQQGVLGPSGTTASCFSADVNLHCIGVDINPGSNAANRINPTGDAIIKVALLADSQVHAADINQATIRFGAHGTEAPALQCHQEDVNHDGLADLVCTFKVSQGGFAPGDWFGIVSGMTLNGQAITGSDAVVVAGSL